MLQQQQASSSAAQQTPQPGKPARGVESSPAVSLPPQEIDPSTALFYTPHTLFGLITGGTQPMRRWSRLESAAHTGQCSAGGCVLVYYSRAFNPPGPKLAEADSPDHTVRHGLIAAVCVWLGAPSLAVHLLLTSLRTARCSSADPVKLVCRLCLPSGPQHLHGAAAPGLLARHPRRHRGLPPHPGLHALPECGHSSQVTAGGGRVRESLHTGQHQLTWHVHAAAVPRAGRGHAGASVRS